MKESFLGTKDVASLFVLSRVFYDHAATLVERHQVLKASLKDSTTSSSPTFWGLMATISLSRDGKKAIKEIGSLE